MYKLFGHMFLGKEIKLLTLQQSWIFSHFDQSWVLTVSLDSMLNQGVLISIFYPKYMPTIASWTTHITWIIV